MSHYLTSDDKYRDLIYRDDCRSSSVADRKSPGGYKFGRTQGNRFRVHARRAFGDVNGYLKRMIEAIANAKLRRMERELGLRGIRFDHSSNDWAARRSGPAERQ
jgi:hypothetical protein